MPDSIKKLIESFKMLPGIGEKTAERLAFSVLDFDEDQIKLFSDSISLVNKIKKQLTIKWKKNTKASGYQVVYSTNKKFTGKKTVRKAKTTTSYKIKGLKKGKKYYVKVRSYKTVNGKRIYGAYSTAKKATIK